MSHFLIVSDTHGQIEKAAEFYEKCAPIDAILHLGDLAEDAAALSGRLGVDVISVRGNMDNGYRTEDAYRIIDTEYGKVLLTHGHMQNVKSTLNNLLYLAEEQECRVALFGHTHIPFRETAGDILLLNPGSLTCPAGGRAGSCAELWLTENSAEANFLYAEKSSVSKSKVRGGFLRDLLNNSDRF